MMTMNDIFKGNIMLAIPLPLSSVGISLFMMIDIIGYIGLFVLASVGCVCFFYWFVLKNKKIDVYVQPKIFNWKIKTALLLIGTIIILVPLISFGIIGGGVVMPTMAIFYIIFLLGLVVCPILILFIFFGFLLMNLGGLIGLFSWIYVIGILMIYLSLFATVRQAVDTLILRIREIGDFDTADHMERYSKIGIGSFLLILFLPAALITRCIRRATKTGLVKITLSVTPSSGYAPRGYERWTERWTTVNLEKMSESHQEVLNRIESIMQR